MEFTSIILPIAKNMCRTCLAELDSDEDTTLFMNIQDVVEHETIKVKLIDILVFLNCLQHNDEENWPQGMCTSCISTALMAYNFKLNCLKANATISQIFTIQTQNLESSDIDNIDINVVYQDHEYELPFFSSQSVLEFDSSLPENKEIIPLPPVTEMTSTEHPPRKEGEKKYACNFCGKSFTRVYGLRNHIVKHNDYRKHLCPKCGKCFHTANGLNQHLISHKDLAQFKCGFCNKTYKSRQSLKEHFRIAHSSNRKHFVCVTCGKSFTAKSTLTMHLKSHNGNKFACPVCPKTYTRLSYLRVHSLIHKGQHRPRPFQCNYEGCERNFVTKYSLVVHIAHAHSAERPYKCDICSKRFPTLSGLKIHGESHTARNVTCEVCHKTLSNKRILQKHMKSHQIN